MTNINDKKYKEYKKRRILKYVIIILSFLTIVLESLALFQMISYIWGLIPFCICYIVKYFYEGNTIERKSKKDKKKDDQKKK